MGGYGRTGGPGTNSNFTSTLMFGHCRCSVLSSAQLRARSDEDDDEFDNEHDDFNSNDVRSFIWHTLAAESIQ